MLRGISTFLYSSAKIAFRVANLERIALCAEKNAGGEGLHQPRPFGPHIASSALFALFALCYLFARFSVCACLNGVRGDEYISRARFKGKLAIRMHKALPITFCVSCVLHSSGAIRHLLIY